MWKDPVVEEVREAREELAIRAGYDFKIYINNLSKTKVVSRIKQRPEAAEVKI